jgi:hypothetical protein
MKQSNNRSSDYTYSPSTLCVHEGTLRDPISGGVNTPIFPSSAIDYRTKDIRYPRNFNTPISNIRGHRKSFNTKLWHGSYFYWHYGFG